MPIRYYLQENAIASNPKDLKARTRPYASYDHEAIIVEMLKMGSTITEADIHAVMTTFYSTICRLVSEGNNVNLPIANFRTGIAGKFATTDDHFDSERHSAKATITSGKLLRKMMAGAALEKTNRIQPRPEVALFIDINSGTQNNAVTPNGIGQLTGVNLDFNPNNLAEGVVFKSTDGTEHKISQFVQRTKRKPGYSNRHLSSRSAKRFW